MRRGFTIIEVVVVVTVLALIATIGAASLTWRDRPATAADAVARVTNFDALARTHARRFDRPAELVYSLDDSEMYRRDADGHRKSTALRSRLPKGYRIARLIRPDESVTQGRAQIPCSGDGRTMSYAVWLTGPALPEAGTWLVVSGLTGTITQATDEDEVRAIFLRLRPPRDDAD